MQYKSASQNVRNDHLQPKTPVTLKTNARERHLVSVRAYVRPKRRLRVRAANHAPVLDHVTALSELARHHRWWLVPLRGNGNRVLCSILQNIRKESGGRGEGLRPPRLPQALQNGAHHNGGAHEQLFSSATGCAVSFR